MQPLRLRHAQAMATIMRAKKTRHDHQNTPPAQKTRAVVRLRLYMLSAAGAAFRRRHVDAEANISSLPPLPDCRAAATLLYYGNQAVRQLQQIGYARARRAMRGAARAALRAFATAR
jgi:hypothetical protein